MTALRTMLADWQPPRFEPVAPSCIKDAPNQDARGRDRAAEARRAIEETRAINDLAGLPRFALSYGLQSPDDPAVGGETGFGQLVAEAVRRADRPSARAVLRAYLDGFDPKRRRTVYLAEALDRLAARLTPDALHLVEGLGLADPRRAVETVARYVRSNAEWLRRTRPAILSTPLGAHGVARAIEAMVRDDAPNEPKEKLTRLIALANGSEGRPSPRLRELLYPALVRPFLDGTPHDGWRTPVRELAVDGYGDPRLPTFAQPRLYADDDGVLTARCVAVVRGWLAVETFRLFIAVIDETGVDDQWEARRDFWLQYFEIGAVSDVRAIFATEADRAARRIRARPGNRGMTWAKLGQAQPNQSVLLIQIGPLRIAEWSHSGRVRFWLPQTRPQPWMNAVDYIGPELREGSIRVWHPDQNANVDGFVHHANGRWRSYTAAVIAKHAGVRT